MENDASVKTEPVANLRRILKDLFKSAETMKKRPTNDDSDEFDVDEPEEFEESGSDWDPEDETAGKKRKGRPKASGKKSNKKKKIEKPPSEDEEEEENDDEEEEEEGEEEEEEESEEESAGPEQAGANGTTTPNISVKAFTNGSFVVLKSDFTSKGNPPLWKIDGKALLQKYIPFEQGGKTLYKNTSTYSGWTPSNQDQYAPAPVTYVQQGKKEIIIEFNRDKVQLGEEKEDAKNETTATVDV